MSFVSLIVLFHLPCAMASGELSLGGLIGVGNYSDHIGSKLSLGGKIQFRFFTHLGIGFVSNFAYLGNESGGAGADFIIINKTNIRHHHGELTFHFDPWIRGLWIGGRLGIGVVTIYQSASLSEVTIENQSSIQSFEYGPSAGWDFHLTKHLTLGIDFSYLKGTYNGTTLDVTQYLSAIKIHF